MRAQGRDFLGRSEKSHSFPSLELKTAHEITSGDFRHASASSTSFSMDWMEDGAKEHDKPMCPILGIRFPLGRKQLVIVN